jgi:hypothetical protein
MSPLTAGINEYRVNHNHIDLPIISGQQIKPHSFSLLIRAEIPEIGMAALSIIEPLDIFKNSHLGFLTGILSFPMSQRHL